MSENLKNFLGVLFIFSLITLFVWNNLDRKNQLDNYGKYVVAKITKKIHNLKNGDNWKCEFYHNNKLYKAFLPRKIKYNVKVEEYYIIKYSTKDPSIVQIDYENLLKENFDSSFLYVNWDTIPYNLLRENILTSSGQP